MGRVLALDLGTKRIGVASTDTTRTLASPVTVLLRRGSRVEDHKAIRLLVDEYEADAVVVGLPLGLDGREGKATALIRAEVVELEARLGVPIVLHDERFTTATAHQALAARAVKAKDRREIVDKVAAAVLLQSWLDGQRAQTKPASLSAEPGAPLRPTSFEQQQGATESVGSTVASASRARDNAARMATEGGDDSAVSGAAPDSGETKPSAETGTPAGPFTNAVPTP
jgi:putative holliday junction resolvase